MKDNNQRQAMVEFEMAWQEFFKNKPEPRNDEEEKKEQEDFHHWYNHVRKQSDTGKTPAEMYKEIYGKEPPKNPPEVSRMMNFRWDENYNEDFEEKNLDETHKQAVEISHEIFERDVWKNAKSELKDATKKETCQSMFTLGFLAYMKIMDDEMADLKEKVKQSPREFEETIGKFKQIMDED